MSEPLNPEDTPIAGTAKGTYQANAIQDDEYDGPEGAAV